MKRVVAGAVCVVALAGLGVLIHAGTPPTPRWTSRIDRRYPDLEVKLAGGRLLTMPYGHGDPGGPLQVRDVATGDVVLSAWQDRTETNGFVFSPDGGHAVGVIRSGADFALRWADLSTGRQRDSRLGPGNWAYAIFSPDSRLVLAQELVVDENVKVARVRAFDRESGKVIAALDCCPSGPRDFAGSKLLFPRQDRSGIAMWGPDGGQTATLPTPRDQFRVSPDGRRVIVETDAGYDLWNLDGPPKRLNSIPALFFQSALFSDDGRTAVVAATVEAGSYTVRFLDAATGGQRWEHSFAEPKLGPSLAVSPDGRYLALQIEGVMEVIDAHEKRPAWTGEPARVVFSPDSAALLLFGADDATIHVRDAATGRERRAIRMPITDHPDPHFHAGGRQLWLSALGRDGEPPDTWLTRALAWLRRPVPEAKAGLLLGLQWPSGRELLRLMDRGVCDHRVAEDGSFVITFHDEGDHQLIRRWDIPQPKPWAWIVGVPLALGAVLLGLAKNLTPRPLSEAERGRRKSID